MNTERLNYIPTHEYEFDNDFTPTYLRVMEVGSESLPGGVEIGDTVEVQDWRWGDGAHRRRKDPMLLKTGRVENIFYQRCKKEDCGDIHE